MIIDILTLFPDMISGFLNESIIKRSINKGLVTINIHDFRKYSLRSNNQVDDTPYGGGAGMVLQCEPIFRCLDEIKTADSLVILVTPDGKTYNQNMAKTLKKSKHLIIICGHYEGFDERIRTLADAEISIGDYILTGVEVNEHLVHMAVVNQLANNRQGTQSAKTRSEVSGGGRKPWRQKGTGHARQGSTRAPQWTGGGIVFAPKPRDYSFKMNKKEKRIALLSALSSKVAESKIVVLDEFKLDEIKTKKFVEVMNNLKVENALVVLEGENKNVVLSGRNIPSVKVTATNEINTYDVLKYTTLVVTKAAVEKLEEVYA